MKKKTEQPELDYSTLDQLPKMPKDLDKRDRWKRTSPTYKNIRQKRYGN